MIQNNRAKMGAISLNDFLFRYLKKEDLPELEWDGEYTHFRRIYSDAYRRSLTGKSMLWVIELPGSGVIGQAFVQMDCNRTELADGKRIAYIYAFRVKEAYRRHGLGSKLINMIEQVLLNRGIHYVTLNVTKDNMQACSLYERLGYRIVAHEPGCWSYIDHEGKQRDVEEPSWRMVKKISA